MSPNRTGPALRPKVSKATGIIARTSKKPLVCTGPTQKMGRGEFIEMARPPFEREGAELASGMPSSVGVEDSVKLHLFLYDVNLIEVSGDLNRCLALTTLPKE